MISRKRREVRTRTKKVSGEKGAGDLADKAAGTSVWASVWASAQLSGVSTGWRQRRVGVGVGTV